MNAKANPKCDCDICQPRHFIVLMRRGQAALTPPMSTYLAALHEVRRRHDASVPHVANDRFIRVTGLAQLFHQNINRRLVPHAGMAGVLGGVLGAGACVLSNIDDRAIRPFVSAYLLGIGMLIRPPLEIHAPSVGRT